MVTYTHRPWVWRTCSVFLRGWCSAGRCPLPREEPLGMPMVMPFLREGPRRVASVPGPSVDRRWTRMVFDEQLHRRRRSSDRALGRCTFVYGRINAARCPRCVCRDARCLIRRRKVDTAGNWMFSIVEKAEERGRKSLCSWPILGDLSGR